MGKSRKKSQPLQQRSQPNTGSAEAAEPSILHGLGNVAVHKRIYASRSPVAADGNAAMLMLTPSCEVFVALHPLRHSLKRVNYLQVPLA